MTVLKPDGAVLAAAARVSVRNVLGAKVEDREACSARDCRIVSSRTTQARSGQEKGRDGVDVGVGASALGRIGLSLDGFKPRGHHDDPPAGNHHGLDVGSGGVGKMLAGSAAAAVGRTKGRFGDDDDDDGRSRWRASDKVKLALRRSGQSYGNDVGAAGSEATFDDDGAAVGNSRPRASDNERLTQSISGQL